MAYIKCTENIIEIMRSKSAIITLSHWQSGYARPALLIAHQSIDHAKDLVHFALVADVTLIGFDAISSLEDNFSQQKILHR